MGNCDTCGKPIEDCCCQFTVDEMPVPEMVEIPGCPRCARLKDTEGLVEAIRQSIEGSHGTHVLMHGVAPTLARAVQRWVKEGGGNNGEDGND